MNLFRPNNNHNVPFIEKDIHMAGKMPLLGYKKRIYCLISDYCIFPVIVLTCSLYFAKGNKIEPVFYYVAGNTTRSQSTPLEMPFYMKSIKIGDRLKPKRKN